MAQGVGSTSSAKATPDVFGGHLFRGLDYKGPTSYVQGGDALDPRFFAFPNAIVALIGSLDHSNTYRLEPRPMQNGITLWQVVWIVTATGLEAAAGTNLSGFTGRLTGFGI